MKKAVFSIIILVFVLYVSCSMLLSVFYVKFLPGFVGDSHYNDEFGVIDVQPFVKSKSNCKFLDRIGFPYFVRCAAPRTFISFSNNNLPLIGFSFLINIADIPNSIIIESIDKKRQRKTALFIRRSEFIYKKYEKNNKFKKIWIPFVSHAKDIDIYINVPTKKKIDLIDFSAKYDSDIEIIMAGDSHCCFSFNNHLNVKSINIGSYSEPYFATYWKINNLLPYLSVKDLYLAFSFHNITGMYDDVALNLRFVNIQPYGILYKQCREPMLFDREIMWWFIEKFRIGFGLYNFFRFNSQKYTPYGLGFVCEWGSKSINTSRLNKTLKNHFKKRGYVSRWQLTWLKNIIALCGKNDIRVHLVCTPLPKQYLNRIPANIKKNFYNIVKVLTNQYDFVDFFDFSIIKSQNQSIYYDEHHTNIVGANLVTPRMLGSKNGIKYASTIYYR